MGFNINIYKSQDWNTISFDEYPTEDILKPVLFNIIEQMKFQDEEIDFIDKIINLFKLIDPYKHTISQIDLTEYIKTIEIDDNKNPVEKTSIILVMKFGETDLEFTYVPSEREKVALTKINKSGNSSSNLVDIAELIDAIKKNSIEKKS